MLITFTRIVTSRMPLARNAILKSAAVKNFATVPSAASSASAASAARVSVTSTNTPPSSVIYAGLGIWTLGLASVMWEDSHQDQPTYWHDKPIPIEMRSRKPIDCFALEREELPHINSLDHDDGLVKHVTIKRKPSVSDCFAMER